MFFIFNQHIKSMRDDLGFADPVVSASTVCGRGVEKRTGRSRPESSREAALERASTADRSCGFVGFFFLHSFFALRWVLLSPGNYPQAGGMLLHFMLFVLLCCSLSK